MSPRRLVRTLAALGGAALLSASSAFADFVRIDGLSSIPVGPINATTSGGLWTRAGAVATSVYNVDTVDGQKVIGWQGSSGNGGTNYITRTLPSTVSSGTITIFFRFKPVSGNNFDHAFGLTTATGTPYTGYNVQAGIAQGNIASNCDFTNRAGTGNVVVFNDTPRDQWYNLWIVVNASTLTYDTYVTSGSASATVANRVATGLTFRNTALPLSRVMITCNVGDGTTLRNGNISHILVDTAGANLANPAFSGSAGDTDSDGLPDVWEIQYFGNLDQGASGDPDGDTWSNLLEYNAGTNPTTFNSVLFPAPSVSLAGDGNYLENNPITLTATASGLGNLTYQWSKDSTPISGATSASYTLPATLAANSGTYSVTVTDDKATNFSMAATTASASTVVTIIPESQIGVAHYRFEEGTAAGAFGGTSPDSIGANELTVTSPITYTANVATATMVRSGAANTLAADFSDQTSIPAGRGFTATTGATLATEPFTNFTIEAFVRFSSLSGFQTIVGRDDSGNPGMNAGPESLFYFQKNSGNAIRGYVTNRNGALVESASSTLVVANTWYHVALVGNAADGTLRTYINGVLSGTGTGFNGLYIPSAGLGAWTVGRGYYSAAPGDYFNGQIDEVRFSKVALQPSQFMISTVSGLASFATHPASVTANVGTSVTFTAAAVGFPAPSLQWQRSDNGGATWTDLAGATTSSLTINPVAYTDNASFRLNATNTGGTASSNVAVLTVVYPAPTITTAPISAAIRSGTSTTLTVAATGLGSLTYQWLKDGVPLSGETNPTLNVSGLTATAVYSVVVTDNAATASSVTPTTATASATITVIDVPAASRAISLNFVGAASSANWAADLGTFAAGDTAGFLPVANWNNSAAVTAVSIQDSPLGLVDNTGAITGASATWSSTNTWAARTGTGTAVSKTPDKRLFHGYIETRSTTRLGKTTVTVGNIPYPSYDVYVYVAGGASGAVASATVNDAGNTTYFYKIASHDAYAATTELPWVLGQATTLVDAQASTTPASTFLRFANLSNTTLTISVSDAVSGVNGGGIAAVSIVDRTPAGTPTRPLVTTAPASLMRASGESATFTVAAAPVNAGTLSYAWSLDGNPLSGQTSSTLALSGLTSANAGRYTVTITETSALGAASNTATADLVVLDTARPLLINGDIKIGSGLPASGLGVLRTSEPSLVHSDGNFGTGIGSWNRVVGAAGGATRSLLTESTGLAIPGVTFTWSNATGVEENTNVNSGLPAVGNAAEWARGGGDLLLDYLYTTSATTPITCTVGGLTQFAGRKVTLLVYALGPNGYNQITTQNDGATVTFAAANNYQSIAPKLTDNTQGRDLFYNNADLANPSAYVTFDGIISAGGTVSWNIGPDAGVDPVRAAVDGFQLLITDAYADVAPAIASQPTPASQTKMSGTTVTYTVGATGSPAPTIQWEKSTNAGATWTAIPGATGATLTLANITAADGASYRAIVTSTLGTLTSDSVALAVEVVGDLDSNGASDGPVLAAGDTLGLTSFNTGLNWGDGLAPVAGKTYVVAIQQLRSPPAAGDYTFAGDKLLLTTSSADIGNLVWKNDGVLTFPLLQLHGGRINHAATGGFVVTLSGTVLATAPSTIWANNGPIVINAALTGTAQLTLTGNNLVTYSGASTWTGSLNVTNVAGFTLADTGSLTFAPAPAGVVNALAGTGPVTLNGAININTAAATTNLGDSWTLVSTSGAKTYGATFSVVGFTADAGAVGARKWTSGVFQFDEATSVLSVTAVPLTAQQTWRVTYFGSSDNTGNGADAADPDGDGLSNLLEYAFVTNPTTVNRGPVASVNGAGTALTLSFSQPGDASLTYVVEATSDFATWTPVQTYAGLTAAGTVTYTDSVTFSTGLRRFLRVVVTAAP